MSYRTNAQNDRVMFMYKFISGHCPMSFGINVARMAGIPKKILIRAHKKQKDFNNNLETLKRQID